MECYEWSIITISLSRWRCLVLLAILDLASALFALPAHAQTVVATVSVGNNPHRLAYDVAKGRIAISLTDLAATVFHIIGIIPVQKLNLLGTWLLVDYMPQSVREEPS